MRTLENNKGYNQWTRNFKEFWEDRKPERPDLGQYMLWLGKEAALDHANLADHGRSSDLISSTMEYH